MFYEFLKPIFESIAKFTENLSHISENPQYHSWEAVKQFVCFLVSPLIGLYEVVALIGNRLLAPQTPYGATYFYQSIKEKNLKKIVSLYIEHWKFENSQLYNKEQERIDSFFAFCNNSADTFYSRRFSNGWESSHLDFTTFVKASLTTFLDIENESVKIKFAAEELGISKDVLRTFDDLCNHYTSKISQCTTLESQKKIQEHLQEGKLNAKLKHALAIALGDQILKNKLTLVEPASNSCLQATRRIQEQLHSNLKKSDFAHFPLGEIHENSEIFDKFSEEIELVLEIELENRKEWEKFVTNNKEDLANHSCLEATKNIYEGYLLRRMDCNEAIEIETLNLEEKLLDQLENALILQKKALPFMSQVMQIDDCCHDIFIGFVSPPFNFSNLNEELEQLFTLRLVNKAWSKILPKHHFFSRIQSNVPKLAQHLLELNNHCKDGLLSFIDDHSYSKKKVELTDQILIVEGRGNFWITPFDKNTSHQCKNPLDFDSLSELHLSTSSKGTAIKKDEAEILLKNRFLEQETYATNLKEYNFLLPVKLLMQMGESAERT
ncbi:MAG: hypothetical protein H0T62_13520 [Parachlamydiaceae bacterium]|nr:hypothetical protein [Parachlamydiaceae bacterium]